MAHKNKRISKARRWHRSFGASAAIFVIFMVISGLALNHAHWLGLDQQHVSQPVLLNWYGLGGPEKIRSFAVGEQWLSFAGSQLFLDDRHITTSPDGVGALSSGDWLVVAASDELLLLDHEGGLIERVSWRPMGAGLIEALGRLSNGSVVIRSAGRLWQADSEFLNWQEIEMPATAPSWSTSGTAPPATLKAIAQQYRGSRLSMEQLLLDLHSGRIFGTAGVFIYDLLALALGFLSLSGLLMWWRGRRNGQNNGHASERGNRRSKE